MRYSLLVGALLVGIGGGCVSVTEQQERAIQEATEEVIPPCILVPHGRRMLVVCQMYPGIPI
jgi:hypothetical protein